MSHIWPYKDLDFQVILRQGWRLPVRAYIVRMEEMRESMKIVHQAAENIPTGPVNVDVDDRLTNPR